MDHLEGVQRAFSPCLTLLAGALALLTMFACSGSEVTPEPTVPVRSAAHYYSRKSNREPDAAPARAGTLRRYLE